MLNSLVAMAVVGAAQTSSAPDPARLKAIWTAADNRMIQQTDAWFEDGEFPMAIQLLRIRAEEDPHDYETATDLGWMLENVEEWDQALAVYSRFHVDNPKNPDAALPKGEYLFRRKRYAEVIPLFEKSLNDKAHPNMFRLLAHSYDRTGRVKDSLKIWQRLHALYPKDETVKFNLSKIQRKVAGG